MRLPRTVRSFRVDVLPSEAFGVGIPVIKAHGGRWRSLSGSRDADLAVKQTGCGSRKARWRFSAARSQSHAHAPNELHSLPRPYRCLVPQDGRLALVIKAEDDDDTLQLPTLFHSYGLYYLVTDFIT